MAAKIIVTRSKEFINKARGIAVMIDNVEVSRIKSNATEEYIVEPGTHTITCNIDWCGSNVLNLDLKEGETKFLKLKSGLRFLVPLYFIFLISILSSLVFTLMHIPQPVYMSKVKIVVAVIFLLYFAYYLTIGKRKYLELAIDKDNIFN